MAGMSARIALVAVFLAAAVAGVSWLAARAVAGPPAQQTIYCQHGSGLPVGFLTGPGLGQGCPPGFRRVTGAR